MTNSSSSYTLTYFNVRGLAEPIRFLFKLAGQEFKDVRLDLASGPGGGDWDTKKKEYPWEVLPVLEVDGHVISQSAAIGRFLARRFGFAGKDEFQDALCDELVDANKDLGIEGRKWFLAPDDETKAKLLIQLKEVHIPKYFSKFNQVLANNPTKSGWLVGDNVTWADLFVANSIHSIAPVVDVSQEELNETKYPHLGKLIQKVFSLEPIAEWIRTRPETPF